MALARRFLVPPILVTLICWVRYRCKISPRAEVELSPRLNIGRGAVISSFVKVKATSGDLCIGERVSIATGCFLSAGKGGLTLGDHTMLGPNTSVIANDYSYQTLDVPIARQPKTSKGITIGRDVWLGAGCVVTDGVTIGDHCIVAPNSLVSQSLPPRSVAMGNPAKKIFERR